MKHRVIALIVLAVAGLSASVMAQAATYSNLVIFGDSLSDSGNNALLVGTDANQEVASDGYFARIPFASGRYSNGPVWAEHFAASLGLQVKPSMTPLVGGTNYAFGGAQTGIDGTDGPGGFPFSMRTQLGMYMGDTGGVADSSALYVVAGGGNNVRVALDAIMGGADPTATIGAAAAAYAQDIGDIVDALQLAGAQNILVWNTPNYGLTPAALASGAQGSFVATLMSQAMNGALTARLAGEGVMDFDFYGFVSDAVANAGGAFTNVTNACGAPTAGCDAATSLFYDGIHPTAYGHELLASAALAAVVPEPASWALLAGGVLVLALRRRAVQAA